jgi:hypothetical protein
MRLCVTDVECGGKIRILVGKECIISAEIAELCPQTRHRFCVVYERSTVS